MTNPDANPGVHARVRQLRALCSRVVELQYFKIPSLARARWYTRARTHSTWGTGRALAIVPLFWLVSTPAAAQTATGTGGGGGSLLAVIALLAAVGYGAARLVGFDIPVPSTGALLTTNRALIGAVIALLGLVLAGALGLSDGVSATAITGLTLAAVYLVLRDLDEWDPVLFGVVAVATVLVALSASGEEVLGRLFNSELSPILVLGGLAVAWRAIGAIRQRRARR